MRKYTYMNTVKHDKDFETTYNCGTVQYRLYLSQPIRKKSIIQFLCNLQTRF